MRAALLLVIPLAACASPIAPTAPAHVPTATLDVAGAAPEPSALSQMIDSPGRHEDAVPLLLEAPLLPPRPCPHVAPRDLANANTLWSAVYAHVQAHVTLRFNVQARQKPWIHFAGLLAHRSATPRRQVYAALLPASSFVFSSDRAAGVALQKAASRLGMSVTVTINGQHMPICDELRPAKVNGQVALDTTKTKK